MNPENNGVIEDIIEINKLILQYREALTAGNISNNGGFEVKSEIMNNSKANSIQLTYKGKILYVLQQKGNVCGFGSGSNESKINYFLINKEDSQEEDDIAARNYVGDDGLYSTLNLKQYNNPIIEKKSVISTNSIKSLNTISKNLLCLFSELISANGSLGITDKFRQKELVDTFLLVCSECAKNSLLHQQLITALLKNCVNDEYGSLGEYPFFNAFMIAAKNCGNGIINYIDREGNDTELEKIIKSFNLEYELKRATGYDGSFPKELLDRLMENRDQIQRGKLERSERRYLTKKGIRYENGSITYAKNLRCRYQFLIESQYYKDCQALLDLTDENINDKIDSNFVSRVIKYLNKKDIQIVNLMKLSKTDIILRMLEVAKNASEGDKIIEDVINLSGAVISDDSFKCLVKSYHNKCCNNDKEICDKLHKMLALSRYEEQGFLNENEKSILKNFYTTLKSNIEAQLQDLDRLYKSKKRIRVI